MLPEPQKLEYLRGAWLEYLVLKDNAVVFCGTSSMRELPEEANTTNALPKILDKLAEAVGRPIETLKFFELTTYVSWVLFKPGEYDFRSVKALKIGRQIHAEWKKENCPKVVLQIFRHRIGGNAIQKYVPNEERFVGGPPLGS